MVKYWLSKKNSFCFYANTTITIFLNRNTSSLPNKKPSWSQDGFPIIKNLFQIQTGCRLLQYIYAGVSSLQRYQ